MKTTFYKNTARAVGVLYIAGMVIGIGGHVLIQSIIGTPDYLSTLSASSFLLAFGAVLWLIPVAGDAAHGILMFPVLKQFSERVALSYFAARIADAIFIAIMVLFILLQIPLGSEFFAGISDTSHLQTLGNLFKQGQLYAYNFGMITVGISGLMLCYIFYKAILIPRFLAIWGLVGYAILLGGCVAEVMGIHLFEIHTVIGGLWEVFIGVWLIIKGFNAPAIALESANTSN